MIILINRHLPTRSQITRLSRHLNDALPAVLPTETQYALACDATSKRAINAVRAIKGRAPTTPFSIFLPGVHTLTHWRITYPDYAATLARAFWAGPLTLILPTTNPVFKLLGGDGKTVGVRVTPEPIITMLLDATGKPLVATSANPSGVVMAPPAENSWLKTQAEDRNFVWAKPQRYVRRLASTIIDCTGKVPHELRPGPIAKAEWNAALSRGV